MSCLADCNLTGFIEGRAGDLLYWGSGSDMMMFQGRVGGLNGSFGVIYAHLQSRNQPQCVHVCIYYFILLHSISLIASFPSFVPPPFLTVSLFSFHLLLDLQFSSVCTFLSLPSLQDLPLI